MSQVYLHQGQTNVMSDDSAQPPSYAVVMAEQQQPNQRALADSQCWIVVGITSAILCCLPLSIAGAILAHRSKLEAQQKNSSQHRKFLCLAKGMVIAAILCGLLGIIAIVISLTARSKPSSHNPSTSAPEILGPFQRWSSEGIYLGCYTDHSFYRDLNGMKRNLGSFNSVARCIRYCSENRYKYAGLQSGTECFCGDSYGAYRKLDDWSCSARCSGNDNMCGGFETNSVHKTPYIGCFNNQPLVTSSGNSFLASSLSGCQSACAEKGYEFAKYFSNSMTCKCSNDFNRFGGAEGYKCRTPCDDDSKTICGTNATQPLYKTSYNNVDNYNFLGCYKDSSIERDLNEYHMDMGLENSVTKCVETCSNRGYRYAGVQKTDCYCSQSYGKYEQLSDSMCNTECLLGNGSCGGEERNSVYKTYYLGCYSDHLFRSLTTMVYRSDLEKVIPDECISHCESMGYLFAGLSKGDECRCGQDFNRNIQLSEEKCDTRCKDSEEFPCGGQFRSSSIFRTKLRA